MKHALALVLLFLPLRDEKEELKKALEKTAAAKSYFCQWSDELALMGNARPISGATEWQAPDLVTWRTGLTEIVKKGDVAMSKGKDGWVKADDERRGKAIAAKLKPAHETAKEIVEKIDDPKKGKEAEVNKVKYKVISGTLAGEVLKGLVIAARPTMGMVANAIDWKESKAGVDVLIDKKSGRIFRIAIAGDLKAVPLPIKGASGSNTVAYKHSLEFLEYDTSKPMIDPEVKKTLGIEDEEK